MHDTSMTIFIGILALAVLMQSVLLLLVFLYVRKAGESLLPAIRKISEKAETVLEKVSAIADDIRPITRTMADSADIVHGRITEIDGFLGEVMEKSRQEIVDIQETLHDITQHTREAINTLSDNVLMPINRINAITKAVKAAANVFFHRRDKTASDASQQDDNVYF